MLVQTQLFCVSCCRDMSFTFWSTFPNSSLVQENRGGNRNHVFDFTQVMTSRLTWSHWPLQKRAEWEERPMKRCPPRAVKWDAEKVILYACAEKHSQHHHHLCAKMHLKYYFSRGLQLYRNSQSSNGFKMNMFEKCSDVVFQEILQMLEWNIYLKRGNI